MSYEFRSISGLLVVCFYSVASSVTVSLVAGGEYASGATVHLLVRRWTCCDRLSPSAGSGEEDEPAPSPWPRPRTLEDSFNSLCSSTATGGSPVSRRRHGARPRVNGAAGHLLLNGVKQRLDFKAVEFSDDE